ncbi:hypothetical protein OVA24_16925 [Luteolibacter sp. SL250]|uniref:hypothetical protein n=1 Tax=Luteolibacter sp. SL250 TaxID=2995170 RepID=UPI00226EE9D1|nr:hypothetical protein [Luteolibacter sp. SL250]WAC18917.1 hypothetical protein OVA24_16925 [Luteolibacter sp. SL250]
MMLRLHLSRALLAAGISLMFCSALPLVLHIGGGLLGGRGFPVHMELRWILEQQVQVMIIFAALPLLLTFPLAALWFAGHTRRTLSVPWMAAVCGGCLGILLSPAWYMIGTVLDQGGCALSVDDYLDGLHFLGPVSAITGALYFFLHSFFIRQALGKKAWLETRM